MASRAGMMCPTCLAGKGIDPVKRKGRMAPYRPLTPWQRCSRLASAINSALVRYHFGDADGLLRDLALRVAARIVDIRTGLLDALARSPAMR